jgi:hypothetical protein
MTGNLTIAGPGFNPTLALDHKTQANASDIYGMYNGNAQWLLRLGEGGAGNRFTIMRANDAGAWTGTPFAIARDTGQVSLENNFSVAGGASFSGTNDGTNSIWASERITCNRAEPAAVYVPRGGVQIGGTGTALNITGGHAYITSGGIWYNNSNSGGDGFYCNGNSGFRTDKGANTAFYAPNGGAVLGTTLDAGGRITTTSGDGYSVYSPYGGIYAAQRVNGDSIQGRSVIYTHPNNGVQYSPGYSDNGGGGMFCCIAYGAPNYGSFNNNFFHQSGSWVGWNVRSSDSKEFRWSGQSGAVSADSFGQWSDSRLKFDILPIDDAREKVAMLGGYTYTSVDSRDYEGNLIRRAGLIAQDALAVLPEAVRLEAAPCSGVPGYKDTDTETPGKRYTLDYSAIIALLVNDNNGLATRIRELELKLEGVPV